MLSKCSECKSNATRRQFECCSNNDPYGPTGQATSKEPRPLVINKKNKLSTAHTLTAQQYIILLNWSRWYMPSLLHNSDAYGTFKTNIMSQLSSDV